MQLLFFIVSENWGYGVFYFEKVCIEKQWWKIIISYVIIIFLDLMYH